MYLSLERSGDFDFLTGERDRFADRDLDLYLKRDRERDLLLLCDGLHRRRRERLLYLSRDLVL